jgi:hypothetical protein
VKAAGNTTITMIGVGAIPWTAVGWTVGTAGTEADVRIVTVIKPNRYFR